ncbi:hypothetical protein BD560DRAFT_313935, partial [Blakeslea trispora]
FFQEDGKGSVFDEYGNEPFEMEVDNEQFPLENIYDTYMDLKLPSKIRENENCQSRDFSANTPDIVTRKRSAFFHLVYVRGYTVPEAAKELDVPKRTAHYWFKKEEDA